MQTPSAKVLTQFAAGLVLDVIAYATADQSWMQELPGPVWLAPVLAQILAAVAAYLKRETNPARSELAR